MNIQQVPANFYRRLRGWAWKLSTKPFDTGWHITRYSMYRRLEAVGRSLPNKEGRVLSISRSLNLVRILGLSTTNAVEANYPKYDLLALRFKAEEFDFVVSDQVLEHVKGSPQTAIDECYRVLRPGGIAVHTTCLINPVHMHPNDFWRFTTEGLRLLHRSWSEVVEIGGWGNRDVWFCVDRDGMRFEGVPHVTWHPLHRIALKNEPEWPIVTWIVAKKQAADKGQGALRP